METLTITRDVKFFPWQERVLSEAKRFNVIAKGRRSGGTSLVEDIMLDLAIEGHPIGWFSASDKLLVETWDRFARALEPLTRRKQEQKRKLDLITGGGIECWSCESKLTSRGRRYYAVAVDEAAHISNLAETWEGEILPCLLDLRGGAWFPSSPNGLGDFYEIYQRGQNPDYPDWASWQVATYENPNIERADIDGFKRVMSGPRFKQEILAQFVVMTGGVFPDFSRDANVRPVSADEALEYWVSVDPGYRTFAWILSQIDPCGCVRVLESGEWHNCSTEQARDNLKDMPWAQKVRVLASDPAANSVDIQTGLTDLSILRGAFGDCRVAYSYDPVDRSPEKRAERIRDVIKTESGDVRMVIDPSNMMLIQRIEGSVYPKVGAGRGEKQEPVKDGINDHIRDALGYLIVNALPESSMTAITSHTTAFAPQTVEASPWD